MDKLEKYHFKNGKATLHDLAKLTGLSVSAVSQALNQNSKTTIGVSEKSIAKVREIAKKINYKAHWGARSIRSKYMYNIGFLTTESGTHKRFPADFLIGFCQEVNKTNFTVTLVNLDMNSKNYSVTIPSVFRSNRLDVLVVANYHGLSKDLDNEIKSSNIPTVILNDKYPSNSIYVDDVSAAEEMTEYLIERSYKKILFLKRESSLFMNNLPHHSIEDRIRGYTNAMNKAGLKTEIKSVKVDEVLTFNQRLDMSWLDENNLPDVIMAYDDDLANSVAKMLYRRKIRIPEQISLVGFNGAYGALASWCPLTTMSIPAKDMGKGAFEMAMKLLENGVESKVESISFKPSLIIGESTK